jgi:hypothetical protein
MLESVKTCPTDTYRPICDVECVEQVKVWLGENQSHHYVLSRFLISRMLTVTKIPYIKACSQLFYVLVMLQQLTVFRQRSCLVAAQMLFGYSQLVDCAGGEDILGPQEVPG